MSSKSRIIVALSFFLIVVFIGTCGYMVIEDYSMFDSLYMAIITVTTVGFGELKPLSEIGRGFTIALILVGFGSIGFAGHALGESLLKDVWSGKSEIKNMKKEISRLKSHYIICGLGRVGEAAAEFLKEADVDFVIIESKPGLVNTFIDKGYHFLEGDATHESVLLEAGIKQARGLLVLLNSDPDNLFIVLTARELNPTLYIIARAEDSASDKKILRAGADNVISPFATAGKQVASDILSATGKYETIAGKHIPASTVPQWITIQEGSQMVGETLASVSMQMGLEIIGLRRGGTDYISPDPETRLETNDKFLVMEVVTDFDTLLTERSSDPRKIVIIDDNPVILRLYSRLFQKAGFSPMTSGNGREGLNLIIHEKPAAVIVDFLLPGISGVEVCRQVRAIESLKDTKLILFSAEDGKEIREKAHESGADAFIIKSSDAYEVIEAVLKMFKTV